MSHRLLEDVVPGQDDGSVAALPVHHHAVHVGQLGGVEAGRPELALLQDQHPQPVTQVRSCQRRRAQRRDHGIVLVAGGRTGGGAPLLLAALRLEQL